MEKKFKNVKKLLQYDDNCVNCDYFSTLKRTDFDSKNEGLLLSPFNLGFFCLFNKIRNKIKCEDCKYCNDIDKCNERCPVIAAPYNTKCSLGRNSKNEKQMGSK